MASKAFSVGGVGALPTLDDVVSIALGQPISLDAACSERIKKESPAPKAFQPEPWPPEQIIASQANNHLSPLHTRAILITRLLTLMNGKSGCRLQVAEYLAQLLCLGLCPLLPAEDEDAGVLEHLANSCHGAGQACCSSSSTILPLATALEQVAGSGVKAPGLSSSERAVLRSGSTATAGISALLVQGGKRLLTAATAVAALTCEALGAPTKSFDTDVVEAQGFKSAVGVADELQSLLEGSKRVNTLKGSEELVDIVSLPQRLGATADALASAYAAVRSEVQSGVMPIKGVSSRSLQAPGLATAVMEAGRMLLLTAVGALGRVQALAARAPAALPGLDELVREARGVVDGAQASMAVAGGRMLADPTALPGVQVGCGAGGGGCGA